MLLPFPDIRAIVRSVAVDKQTRTVYIADLAVQTPRNIVTLCQRDGMHALTLLTLGN